MLFDLLERNRAEVIDRCREKVALRASPRPLPGEIEEGVPAFLEQLIETLRDEQFLKNNFTSRHLEDELSATAIRHGAELLRKGYTVEQVVHDYGDLCQTVTTLAVDRKWEVTNDEFRTLNRCLDNAIAGAVSEFSRSLSARIEEAADQEMNQRLGSMAHELRNHLSTAMLAFEAIRIGSVGVDGATAAVLDRSFGSLRDLINHSLVDVRLAAGLPSEWQPFQVTTFIAEVRVAASLAARAKGCEFTVLPVPPGLEICGDRALLYSALSNLLLNAFKYSRRNGLVTLRTRVDAGTVYLEVADQCGGLAPGQAEAMFKPFHQEHADRSGLGLGLPIAQRAVEANGGTIKVTNLPGVGCVFTIALAVHAAAAA